MRLHALLWALPIGLAGLYAVVCLVYFLSQDAIIFHPEHLPRDYVFSFEKPFREVYLSADEAELHGIHFFAPDPAGVVLFFHGNAQTVAELEPAASHFTRHGYDVVVPDYRGFGKSGGSMRNQQQFLADARLWVGYVSARYPAARTIIYGYSIGTGPAVHMAEEYRPAMLMLEAPYTSIVDLARDMAPFLPSSLLLKYRLRSDRVIGEVDAPVIIFHGSEDRLIPPEHGRRLAEIAGEDARFFEIPGADHDEVPDTAAYRSLLADFLAELRAGG